MAQTSSDNFLLTHPKPEFEYYRRFDGANYVDWANTTEVINNVPLTRRPHKTYRIAGLDYLCEANGTTFTPKSSAGGGASFTGNLFS